MPKPDAQGIQRHGDIQIRIGIDLDGELPAWRSHLECADELLVLGPGDQETEGTA